MNPQEILDGIVWENPPEVPKGGGALRKGGPTFPWHVTLHEFRRHPGQWGKLPGRFAPTAATNIKNGGVGGSYPGEFETVTRDQRDRKCDLYVRYVGGES